MILLSSNAQHIFWLGRYITRIQYVCQCFPFQQDDEALAFAHAFCLPAFDAVSLNELILDDNQLISFTQLFANMKNNVHELRGVLSALGYAELGQLIKLASENPSYICDVVSDCYDIFEAEAHDIFLFFKLGQVLEQFDRQLRLNQSYNDTLNDTVIVIEQLKNIGWIGGDKSWDNFKNNPSYQNFYDDVQNIFEVNT